MKIKPILLLLCLMVTSGCMFMGDRKVHVSGTVIDETGRPLQGATVRFIGDVEDITNAKGGFLFGGVFPGGRLPLRVTKPGYKTYQGSNSFDYYDVTVTLAAEASQAGSKAAWKTLKENELNNYQRNKE